MKKFILAVLAVFAFAFAPLAAQAQAVDCGGGVFSLCMDQASANACAAGTTLSERLLTIKQITLSGPKNTAVASAITNAKCYWLETNDTAATALWVHYTTAAAPYSFNVNIKVPPGGVRFKTTDTTAGVKPTLYLYTSKDN